MENNEYKTYYCVSNYKLESYLTIDRMYKAEVTTNPKYIIIINDVGQYRRYDVTNRFLNASQYRDKKINEILA